MHGGEVTSFELADWRFFAQKGGVEPSLFLFWLALALWDGGSGSGQASLNKPVSHSRIGPGCGCDLGHNSLQALPKQTVGPDGKGVGMLCQLISLAGLGTGAYPQGLCPKGTESTLDCPTPTYTIAILAKLTPALAREATWV